VEAEAKEMTRINIWEYKEAKEKDGEERESERDRDGCCQTSPPPQTGRLFYFSVLFWKNKFGLFIFYNRCGVVSYYSIKAGSDLKNPPYGISGRPTSTLSISGLCNPFFHGLNNL
jgi:hypothetical protein